MMNTSKSLLQLRLVVLSCCLGVAYAAFSWHDGWPTAPAPQVASRPGDTGAANTLQSAAGTGRGELARGATGPGTANQQPRQLPDGLASGNLQAIREYKSYSQWCHLENTLPKRPDALCDKVAVAQNDANFQQQAERLALAGSTSSQLALGLWWHEKARQTLTDYNLAAKNENMVKRFDFDNPTNATDHSAYLAGATLKKQAQQAQRWLTPLAASHPDAADALGSLRFQGLLP